MKQSELLRSDWTHLFEEREEVAVWGTQKNETQAYFAL
jgi:hypothetical protein